MVPIVIVDNKRLLNSSIPNLGSADSWSMAKTAGGGRGRDGGSYWTTSRSQQLKARVLTCCERNLGPGQVQGRTVASNQEGLQERKQKNCPWAKQAMWKIFSLEFRVGKTMVSAEKSKPQACTCLKTCLNLHQTCSIGLANLRN